jgi:hypothetical protein
MDTGGKTSVVRFINLDALIVPANDPINDPTMKSRLRITISSSAVIPELLASNELGGASHTTNFHTTNFNERE